MKLAAVSPAAALAPILQGSVVLRADLDYGRDGSGAYGYRKIKVDGSEGSNGGARNLIIAYHMERPDEPGTSGLPS